MQTHNHALIADIGGTNARFALVEGPGATPVNARTLPCAGYPTLDAAVKAYLEAENCPVPEQAVIAIATNVSADRIRMTNHHWDLSVRETRSTLGLRSLKFINDFTALALALPLLGADERVQVGGGAASDGQAMAVLGPGTGLGVSGLIPSGSLMIPLQGEGGHATYGPVNEREAGVIDVIRRSFEHVSIERLVSGPGIVLLYRALALLDGRDAIEAGPQEVTDMAISKTDATAVEAVQIFCGILGTAAGNLALTLGARGGVYIGGGIVPKLGNAFLNSPFRERFEAHGRFRGYLAEVPTCVIHSDYPALQGAAAALAGDYQYLGVTDTVD
jgi:glucokinase